MVVRMLFHADKSGEEIQDGKEWALEDALSRSKQVQLVLVSREGPKVHIENPQHHVCNG